MALIVPRNRLVFPGTPPRFNPAHLAACGGPIRLAAVASSGNMINLLSGAPGTPTTAIVNVTDGIIGPAATLNASTAQVSFSGLPVTTDTSFTAAAIVRFLTFPSYQAILHTSTAANQGYGFWLNNGNIMWREKGNNRASSGSTLTVGVQYFVVISGIMLLTANFVAKRLDTGKILTGSISLSGVTTATASNGTCTVGNAPSVGTYPVNGNLAAAMYAVSLLSPAQLLQWADDPWSLWYAPSQGPLIISSLPTPSAPGPITGALNVVQANQTVVAAGGPMVGGALSVTQANQTLAAIGKVAAGGALNVVQAAQTLAAAGGPIVGGALNAVQAAQALAGTGKVAVGGVLGLTQANQALATSGAILVGGALNVSQAPQTLSGAGNVFSGIGGALNVTQANQTLVAAGTVPIVITGALNVVQAPQTLVGSASVAVRGNLVLTQVAQTLSAAGQVGVVAAVPQARVMVIA